MPTFSLIIRRSLTLYWEIKRRCLGTKFMAEFDVTDKCNLRCSHCYHFEGKDHFETQKTPLNEWQNRLQSLYQQGVRIVLIVGGEPALRPDIIKAACTIFPYVDVITNGTLAFPESKNLRPIVSIDGAEETNDSIRGKGVFKKAISSNLQNAILNFTVTHENYKELEQVIKTGIDQGFKGLTINIYTPTRAHSNIIGSDLRANIIQHLKELKALYPNFMLLSKQGINWYQNPYSEEKCYWQTEAHHYDVNWQPRKCFSENMDCHNCGCFAGAETSRLIT